MHGADLDALAAAQAVRLLHEEVVLLAQHGNGVDALDGGDVQVVLRNAHHGAAGEDLVGVLGVATGVDQVVEAGADGNQQVLRLHKDVAGHGDDSLDEWHSVVHHIVDGAGGRSVEYRAAHRGGQTAGGNFPAGDGVDQLLFSALRVLGRQHIQYDTVQLVLLQRLNGFWLVVLDGNVSLCQAEDLHDDLQALHQLRRMLPAQPVVSRYVRLALAGVDDDGIHLADAAGELDVGGESRTAHADDAALPDNADQLFRAECVHLFLRAGLDVLTQGIQMVILDHHTHHGGTAGVGAHFHSLDLTGDGSVDRHTQSLIIADLLTHGHRVTLLHEGVAGGADMLGHGDHNDIRLGENLSLLVAGIPLIFFGMDPAEKRKRHITSPLSNFAAHTALYAPYSTSSGAICPQ